MALLSDRDQLNKVDTMMVKMGTTSISEVTCRLRIGEKSSLTSSKTVGWWFLRVAATLLAALCCAGRVCAATTAASGENVSTDEVPTMESGVLYNLPGAVVSAAVMKVEESDFLVKTSLYPAGTILCKRGTKLAYVDSSGLLPSFDDGGAISEDDSCLRIETACLLAREFRE